MESSNIIVHSSEESLSVFDTSKEEWTVSPIPMDHPHTLLHLSCDSDGFLCFSQGTILHLYHTQTKQCLEIPLPGVGERLLQVLHCSSSPAAPQSFQLVVLSEEHLLVTHNSSARVWDDVALPKDLYYPASAVAANNKVYLLGACCELAVYDLEKRDLSWFQLELAEGLVSDLSLDLNLSVLVCHTSVFMVGYHEDNEEEFHGGEYNSIAIWKLNREAESWELVSKVMHVDDDESTVRYGLSCSTDGVDKIWILTDKPELMLMYSLELETWTKLQGCPQPIMDRWFGDYPDIAFSTLKL